MRFLFLLAQSHPDFWVAELQSVADLYGIEVDFATAHDPETPFLVIDLPSFSHARRIAGRLILCRAVYEFYGVSDTFDGLTESVAAQYPAQYWQDRFGMDSFKFEILSYRGTCSKEDQVKMINAFAFTGLEGPIRMKKPDHVFTILEEYEFEAVVSRPPKRLWFGRLVGTTDRHAMDRYDLKKRPYIGTTSFDAELALVSCNIAQLEPGKIMYDPFAGTGSFLVAAAHHGAMALGSDIDIRMIRGKDKTGVSAGTNFAHYGTSNKYLGSLTMDFTNNAFRPDLKFDAIVCDPPYGVREGLKVLGSKDPERFRGKDEVRIDGVLAHLRKDYIAPKRPYLFSSLLNDLVAFAYDRLHAGGRLCVWIPTANDEAGQTAIPQHRGLKLRYNCVQDFGNWSRRLLVYERLELELELDAEPSQLPSAPPTKEFRDLYFTKFNLA